MGGVGGAGPSRPEATLTIGMLQLMLLPLVLLWPQDNFRLLFGISVSFSGDVISGVGTSMSERSVLSCQTKSGKEKAPINFFSAQLG